MSELRETQQELANLKQEINDILPKVREVQAQYAEVVKDLVRASNRIDLAMQKLIMPVVEEIESAGGPGPRKRRSSNLDTSEAEVKEVVKKAAAAPKLEKGKRACSKCRLTGHRATTCPN